MSFAPPGSSTTQPKRNDPGWKYNFLKDPHDSNCVTCMYCNFTTKGGIYRAKQHQIGGYRNAKKCTKCPTSVRNELKAYMDGQKAKKNIVADGFEDMNFEDDDEVIEIPSAQMKRSGINIGGESKKVKSNVKGPLDMFMSRAKGKSTNMRQTSINDACDKQLRARTIQTIAAFFYQAGIAFNVAKLECFKEMIDAIGNYGPNLKPPTYHELRVPLLKIEVDNVEKWVDEHKVEWSNFGCSIMSDGWTDRRHRTLINFLVNSPKGTVFMESVDASSYVKTGEKIFELLDKFVERIGESNVIQVITDNGSNFKQAGKLLMDKRKHLFWTPCAAHCLDLMLEDIGKIPKVKTTIEKGIFLVGYIYNHGGVLNLMREFTKNKELSRTGITRFATTYLTLQSLHKQKAALRNMFISEKWSGSKWAKEIKGKRAQDVVFTPNFWNNVLFSLKVMCPIVKVLRLVDNEKKPAMGYVYEAINRAKTTIKKTLGEGTNDYNMVSKIIDKRWDCQLHQPLHAAGFYLNPEFYCYDPSIEDDQEVMDGLLKCIQKLVPSKQKQDLIMKEMVMWVMQEGHFGLDVAKRAHGTIAPAQWWRIYGKSTPNMQHLAIKILSLTCSSSGCERNWSTFEHIHSKKRNRLEHKKLHDLVFVKYNKTLKNRHDKNVVYDPISLDDIDDSNEWLTGRMEDDRVFENEDLRWDEVEDACGAGEVRKTRSSQPSSSRASQPSSRTLVDEDVDEDVNEETDVEEDTTDESEADYPNEVEGSSEDFDDGLDD